MKIGKHGTKRGNVDDSRISNRQVRLEKEKKVKANVRDVLSLLLRTMRGWLAKVGSISSPQLSQRRYNMMKG